MGLTGGTLLQGWMGRAYKEWTIVNSVKAGAGLPETPVYLAAVTDTGFSGSIRPDRTSAPLYATTTPGRFLSSASFTAPRIGQWGDAGRDSITGPRQLTFNTPLARTFRLSTRYKPGRTRRCYQPVEPRSFYEIQHNGRSDTHQPHFWPARHAGSHAQSAVRSKAQVLTR